MLPAIIVTAVIVAALASVFIDKQSGAQAQLEGYIQKGLDARALAEEKRFVLLEGPYREGTEIYACPGMFKKGRPYDLVDFYAGRNEAYEKGFGERFDSDVVRV